MTKLFVYTMFVCIVTATRVSANPAAGSLDAFDGLGSDRATLTSEQIAARSLRLEESTSFSLLRFPEARRAPARIFDPRIWNVIERSAREYDLDPMILAGMIFIESFGDPLAKSPTGPAGIAQLTKGSARELGLSTGKKVKIGTRPVKRTRYIGKGKNRRKVVETRQESVYKTIDERYVPERAIPAMARRVANRRAWLGGKVDFAIAEYHMGAGRMARLLSAYFDRTVKVSNVTSEMLASRVSYSELFWTNTPYFRSDVYDALDDLNKVDYSPTDYFRVRPAMRLLDVYRQSPPEYAEIASAYQGRFGYSVLPSWQLSFIAEEDPQVVPVRSLGDLQSEMGERFVLLPELSASFGVRSGLEAGGWAIAGERSTVGSALFVAHQLKRLQGDRYRGFEISNMLTPEGEDGEAFPLHSRGWAFDIRSSSLSSRDERDLKFVLADLRQAGLLAYDDDHHRDSSLHIVRHPDHALKFEQFYWDVMAGAVPAPPPVQVATVSGGLERVDRSGLDDAPPPRVLVALTSFFSRVFSFFGF